jgi:ribonuclease VapC
LESARSPITSPIAIFEAALRICRKRHTSLEEAAEDVREFLGVAAFPIVSITEREPETAVEDGVGVGGVADKAMPIGVGNPGW